MGFLFSKPKYEDVCIGDETLVRRPKDPVKVAPAPAQPARMPEMCAALDVGRTYSGYMFSFRPAPRVMYSYSEWGADCGLPFSHKTLSCVLTDGGDKVLALGHDALVQYGDLLPEQLPDHRLYRPTPTVDHDDDDKQEGEGGGRVWDVGGRASCSRLQFTAAILRELKLHMLQEILKRERRSPDERDIRWVLPVSVTRSEHDRDLMRQAAVKAGLVQDVGDVVVVTQSEATFLFCKDLNSDDFLFDTGLTLSRDKPYMVVDCGGGGVDVAVHRPGVDDGGVQLLHSAALQPGAARINQHFLDLLDNMFDGGPFTDVFRQRCPADFTALVNTLETLTSQFTASTDRVSLQVMYQLGATYAALYNKELEQSVRAEFSAQGVRFWRGKLFIPASLLTRAVLEPVTGAVVARLMEQLDREREEVGQLVLVGGLAASHLLQQALHTALDARPAHCRLLVAKDAASVVLKGAVLRGYETTSRETPVPEVPRFSETWGLRVWDKANKSVPGGEQNVETVEGARYVKDRFHVFVKKGDDVTDSVTRCYYPVSKNQSRIKLQVVSSSHSWPSQAGEGDVRGAGQFEVGGKGVDRRLDVTMYTDVTGCTRLDVKSPTVPVTRITK